MSMNSLRTGPDWLLWAVFVLLVAISAILLSGHGANLIAGYNTAPKMKKAKYDEKRLGRVVGAGVLAIAVPLPFVVLGQALLPIGVAYAIVVYAYLAFIIVDSVIVLILANTICKK